MINTHNEKQITTDSFEIGKILKMNFDRTDGIIINHPFNNRLKYFVVIGQSLNEGIVGALLINSKISSKTLEDYQFPLHKKDYPDILKYNSFLDCCCLFELDKIKIVNKGFEIGKLIEKDLKMIIHTVKECEIISTKNKKKFGII